MSPQAFAALFSFLLVVVVMGFLLVATYNSVVTLGQQASKAWANIDVSLKQRHDELPNLVEAVKGLMAFEQATLMRVTKLRAVYSSTEPIPTQAATSEATSSAVRHLFAVVERYPDIKSQANVLDLQRETQHLEDIIADRRELYNDTVYRFNTRIGQFPSNTLTRLFGWTARPFFSAPGELDTPAVQLTE